MRTDTFWSLIEKARGDATRAGRPWPAGTAVGPALTQRLTRLRAKRIVEFHRCYERENARADRWDLCAAAYVIGGYLSDDTFSGFRAGLVGLGRAAFDQAVADADTLADHPMVCAMAAGHLDRGALESEEIEFAASTAFEQRAGDEDDFWEELDALTDEAEPSGEDEWSGRFGSADDLARIPARLPRLFALFQHTPPPGS
ncbi:hypothetical protein BLA60_26440 [Actinophytocola xinjiangensis]|uniref:DUF4240 domain-containing protein n=1 Tax=Actinophytocola xinjiangensis TaxID=485602 RepID=A0A7Z0WIU0_9PSEU|nr:DUF4240 domain-containing protein [Actinophytocola xinjiangensis]OLF07475.1 hypothetical protein BLA60_26440 [Actinophytocola xinjiangensis]